MPAPVPKSARDHTDITEAVRDTVTVRGNTDYSSRNHMARSQTSNIPSHSSRPAQPRSQSQDSANRPDKSKASVKSRPKKGSQHADVIDRLDFTGVGPMFHHDGPFDACAPSRNRQRNKAPMFAWTPRPDDIPASSDSAYPSAHAHKAFSNTNYVDPPKKKVDAIAEAWGIHEPEPYEEFFAGGGTGRTDGDTPASSIYNGKDSHSQSSRTANGQKRGKEARDIYREYLEGGQPANGDAARPRVATRRTLVPPPQPIFVPDPAEIPDAPGLSPPLSAPGFPKRSKSLMHRIRKMRDAPNVPVGSDYDQTPPSPTSLTDATSNTPRPTHRPQNSFLGRFGGGGARNASATSDKSEPFVYIEANNKELPAPPPGVVESPPDVPVMGYFDNSANSGSPGLGRKTSLLKKVGRVVGRGRQ
ncbi:hypothetical protein DXG03_002764 [Asterophora parasitica]|uniref:Pal1 cell morphology n=1 Tax=Asterophora parasitica TaxID=117018 RepID=A0A9P7G421_9AGAR|nr:hypothetical protein DXG03_002764 [Asterophora parasitica]